MAIYNSRLTRKKPLGSRKQAIPKVTADRLSQLSIYSVEEKIFKLDNPVCIVCQLFYKHDPTFPIHRCHNKTAHVHHKWGKEDDMLLNKEYWLATCEFGHDYELNNPLKAYDAGVSIRRNITLHQH